MNHTAYGTFAIDGDLAVDRIGFGALRLARNGRGDATARDPETARAVLRRAAELGVDHIDTADFYRSRDGTMRANDLIREALFPYPAGLVIATKVGPVFGPDGPTQGTAAGIRPAVEANLDALGTDRLDLVYLRIGWRVPPRGESLSERFEVLAALREEGLILISSSSRISRTSAGQGSSRKAIEKRFKPSPAPDLAHPAVVPRRMLTSAASPAF